MVHELVFHRAIYFVSEKQRSESTVGYNSKSFIKTWRGNWRMAQQSSPMWTIHEQNHFL